VAGELGDGAVGDCSDGEPVGAGGVHTDQGEGGSGGAGVYPVAPGTVFGDCEVLPGGWERVFGGDSEGRGNWPMPKGPMPSKVFDPQTNGQTDRQADPQKKREAGRRNEATATSTKYQDGPRQRANAASVNRDAKWVGQREPEPRRDSVPNRGTASGVGTEEGTTLRQDSVQAYRGPTAVAREFSARIEEPIAARLLSQDAWRGRVRLESRRAVRRRWLRQIRNNKFQRETVLRKRQRRRGGEL